VARLATLQHAEGVRLPASPAACSRRVARSDSRVTRCCCCCCRGPLLLLLHNVATSSPTLNSLSEVRNSFPLPLATMPCFHTACPHTASQGTRITFATPHTPRLRAPEAPLEMLQ